MNGPILCEPGELLRGVHCTSCNVNGKTYSCVPSASNCTRGPCRAPPWSPWEHYLCVFNLQSLRNPSQSGIQFLSVQLISWETCNGDTGRGKDLEKKNTTWKKEAFPLYIFKRSYYVVKHKCIYLASKRALCIYPWIVITFLEGLVC